MRIRRLQPDDDRSAFSCGDPDYDDFIRKYAGQNQFVHHLSTTIVVVEDEVVVGYATVAPAQAPADAVGAAAGPGLPRYPLPVLRLGRLAVDRRFQHLGLGGRLVAETIEVALRLRDDLGCVGVIVDALQSRAGFYEGLGFVRIATVVRGRSGVTGTVLMFLALSEAERAAGDDTAR